MRDKLSLLVIGLVSVATSVYTFQPIILEQLAKDGNLDPRYKPDEKLVQKRLGDLTDASDSDDANKNR